MRDKGGNEADIRPSIKRIELKFGKLAWMERRKKVSLTVMPDNMRESGFSNGERRDATISGSFYRECGEKKESELAHLGRSYRMTSKLLDIRRLFSARYLVNSVQHLRISSVSCSLDPSYYSAHSITLINAAHGSEAVQWLFFGVRVFGNLDSQANRNCVDVLFTL
jgi:hypothetical protein